MNGSQVNALPGAVITGGTLHTAGALSMITLDGATLQDLTSTAFVQIANDNAGTLQGTIANQGTIRVASGGNSTDLFLNGNVTLTGAGSITTSGNSNNRILGNAGDLLTSANTIMGGGQLGVNTLRILNTGQIIANVPQPLVIDPQNVADGFASTGLLRADGATLLFASSTYTLGGTIEAVNGGLLQFSAGAFTFSSPVTLNNGTAQFSAPTQSAKAIGGTGTVSVAGVLTSDGVTLAGAWQVTGTHTIRAGVGNAGTSRVNTVPAVNLSTGRLDLTDNALIVDTADTEDKLSKIAALDLSLRTAQAGGPWTGRGITSAAAAASPAGFGVGLFDNADLGRASLAGATINADSLFVMLAHYGDGNFDGKVDAFDLNLLASNWQRPSGATWSDGDFTYDGVVNAFDLNVLAAHWQFGAGGSFEAALAVVTWGGASHVPEPATLAVMAALAPLMWARRRRVR